MIYLAQITKKPIAVCGGNYNNSFGYDDFAKIKNKMPWIVEFAFDDNAGLLAIRKHDLF